MGKKIKGENVDTGGVKDVTWQCNARRCAQIVKGRGSGWKGGGHPPTRPFPRLYAHSHVCMSETQVEWCHAPVFCTLLGCKRGPINGGRGPVLTPCCSTEQEGGAKGRWGGANPHTKEGETLTLAQHVVNGDAKAGATQQEETRGGERGSGQRKRWWGRGRQRGRQRGRDGEERRGRRSFACQEREKRGIDSEVISLSTPLFCWGAGGAEGGGEGEVERRGRRPLCETGRRSFARRGEGEKGGIDSEVISLSKPPFVRATGGAGGGGGGEWERRGGRRREGGCRQRGDLAVYDPFLAGALVGQRVAATERRREEAAAKEKWRRRRCAGCQQSVSGGGKRGVRRATTGLVATQEG
ncbi:hypothetical protein V8E53_011821 [Lactarius tabidus]